jgi:hypothetical protein
MEKKYRAYIRVRGVINQGTDYGNTVSFFLNMSQIFPVIGQIDRLLLRGNPGVFLVALTELIFKKHLQFGLMGSKF